MARNYFDAVINDAPDVRTEVQTYIAAIDKAVAINQLGLWAIWRFYQITPTPVPTARTFQAWPERCCRPSSETRTERVRTGHPHDF